MSYEQTWTREDLTNEEIDMLLAGDAKCSECGWPVGHETIGLVPNHEELICIDCLMLWWDLNGMDW